MFGKSNGVVTKTMSVHEFDDTIISIASKMQLLSVKIIELYGDFQSKRYIYSYVTETKFLDLNKLYKELSNEKTEISSELEDSNYKSLIFLERHFPVYFKMLGILGTLYGMIHKLSPDVKTDAMSENLYIYKHIIEDNDYVMSLSEQLQTISIYKTKLSPFLDYEFTENQHNYIKTTLKFCMRVANALNELVNSLKSIGDETTRLEKLSVFDSLIAKELQEKISSDIEHIEWK